MGCRVNELLRVNLRWMAGHDLRNLCEIGRQSGEHPWGETHFQEFLSRTETAVMVAEYDSRTIGFIAYEALDSGIFVRNLVVVPAFRRRGVASQMFARLCYRLNDKMQKFIRLDVRESNVSAQLFFKALGFRATHILKDFFEDTGEDAYRMQYRHKQIPICGKAEPGTQRSAVKG